MFVADWLLLCDFADSVVGVMLLLELGVLRVVFGYIVVGFVLFCLSRLLCVCYLCGMVSVLR